MHAVIDRENPTGAIYGVGKTPGEALADAKENGVVGERTMLCTMAVADYVREHGGAPSKNLVFGPSGIHLLSEE